MLRQIVSVGIAVAVGMGLWTVAKAKSDMTTESTRMSPTRSDTYAPSKKSAEAIVAAQTASAAQEKASLERARALTAKKIEEAEYEKYQEKIVKATSLRDVKEADVEKEQEVRQLARTHLSLSETSKKSRFFYVMNPPPAARGAEH